MAQKIKVILLEDIENVGRAGDIVAVSEGYARNKLFPGGQAALATDSAVKQAQHQKQKREAATREVTAKLQELASKLDDTELALLAKVKEGNEIFGKITAAQIAKQLNQQAQLSLKPKDILLTAPITQLGTYPITVQLAKDVEAHLVVTVEADPASVPSGEDED